MLRWAYCLSTKIIVHNETGRGVLVNLFYQDPSKIVVIPHGPLAAPQQADAAPGGELRLLIFGGIRENKGVHLAIEAVQSINSEGISRVHLTIAGEVANAREQGYWDRCASLIERNPEGIRVMNRYIDDTEVGSLVREHHAMLLPYSGFTSESGVAALSLANKRPIIASRAGGLGALLNESSCGIAIEQDSVEGVAAAILKAREAGPEGLRRMGEAGSALMQSGRSWTEIGRRTLAVYSEICGSTAGVQN